MIMLGLITSVFFSLYFSYFLVLSTFAKEPTYAVTSLSGIVVSALFLMQVVHYM